jgi:hypothetical protein
MMITPFGISDDSQGKPVNVLKITGEGSQWDLLISCDGNAHRLKFNGGRLEELFDHKDNFEEQEMFARLGDVPSACECIRIKFWHFQFGISILEDIMP